MNLRTTSRSACSALGLLAALTACSSDDEGGGGTGGATTSDASAGGAGGAPVEVEDEGPFPTIPAPTEACPTLVTGVTTILGIQVELFVGERREDLKGAVLFYWHGTGSHSNEVDLFMGDEKTEVLDEGGIVVSFETSTGDGPYTGPFVWRESDLAVADHILACAVEQLNIDTRRIYSAGCSAGALQTAGMAYRRSSYLAGVMANSGGMYGTPVLQDPAHLPAIMTAHGAAGVDVVAGLDFAVSTERLITDYTARGGFVVNCDHGGTHCAVPEDVVTAQWQFLKDHPFGVEPEPYADGLPDGFPSICAIAP